MNKNKLLILAIFFLILGQYLGVDTVDDSCDGGHVRKALRIAITKPFAMYGWWNFNFHYGEKKASVMCLNYYIYTIKNEQ